MSLLELRGLTTAFQTARGEISAIEDISFELNAGGIQQLIHIGVWPHGDERLLGQVYRIANLSPVDLDLDFLNSLFDVLPRFKLPLLVIGLLAQKLQLFVVRKGLETG